MLRDAIKMHFFRPGFSWTLRSVRFIPYIVPAGCIPSASRYIAIPQNGMESEAIGICSSRLVSAFLRFYGEKFAWPKFLVGTVKRLPWPKISEQVRQHLKKCMDEEVLRRRRAYQNHEPFHEFLLPIKVLDFCENGVALGFNPESLLDEEGEGLVAQSFGFDADEVVSIERDLREALKLQKNVGTAEGDGEQEDPDFVLDFSPLATEKTHFCYLIGLVFGRWDARYATGERSVPELPDPFAPLPVCPPGMLQGDNGLPLSPEAGQILRAEGLYPLDVAWDGIVVDDPEHPLDIERRVQAAFSVIWGDQAEQLVQEACSLLGVLNLREWFHRPTCFFADHLKRYSKSRRQAPIYWLLSAGNGSYSVWLYYHRFTADTLYRVLQEYVEPRISQADRDCFEWKQQLALGGTTDAAQQLQSSQALLEDLKQLKAELSLVAPLWKPDLNDGVIINHAILWRITPYAPWQKKVKECWDKLVAEEYDWAHLAFHLWPERVIPKCATDRSLAIAHGLDATFWRENQQGKWEPVPLSEEQLAQVVAAHTNHARSDALQRFLAAPPPLAATRARAPRAAQSASAGTSRARRTTQSLDPELIRQVRLVLTAAPPEGMAKASIAELHATEDAQLTAAIKQLKVSGQIEQLGQKRGARYRLSPAGLAAAEAEGDMD